MSLMNMLVGLPMMLLCLVVQAATTFWSVRHYVRRTAGAGAGAGFVAATRPLLSSMIIMMLGNFAQIVAWGILFVVLDEFGEYYATATRLLRERSAETILTQLWTREAGSWKIVSWHLETPFVGADAPVAAFADVDRTASEAPNSPSHAAIIKAATQFLTMWIAERRYADATVYFAPRSAFCADVKNAGSAGAFLASVGNALPKGKTLGDLITAVPFGHPHLEKVAHDQGAAFLLTRVSTDLAPTLECNAGTPGRSSTMGPPTFDGKTYRVDFGVKSAVGQAGAVSLLWRLERNNWRIVSAEIVAH